MIGAKQVYHYAIYGLAVDSEIELDGLPNAAVDIAAPRIRIIRSSIRDPAISHRDPAIFVNTGATQLLAWAMVGAFRIASDETIEVDSNPEVPDALVALPLLGAVMATFLHRRGAVVFHASSVAVQDRAIVLLGDKGAGKSTAAGALATRGHRLITDDIVALDCSRGDRPLVLPSYGEVKLWPDSGLRLSGQGLTSLGPIHRQIEKTRYALQTAASGSVKLERLYVLRRSSCPRAQVLPAADGVIHLLRHAYLARFGDAGFGSQLQTHFRHSARLASEGMVRVLEVPHGLGRLDEIEPLVLADLDKSLPATM